jgi:hypothetical protein
VPLKHAANEPQKIAVLMISSSFSFEEILPAIVQDVVNEQKLPIRGGALYAESATMLNISIITTLHTPIPATVHPLTLQLYNKNTTGFSPFSNLTFPQVHVDGHTNNSIHNQQVLIQNQTELVKWFDAYFDDADVQLNVVANPKVEISMGVLKSKHHLTQTIHMPGLNYLNGFALETLKLILPAEKNGTNMAGTLSLPNAGVLTLGLGSLTLTIKSGDIAIGTVHVPDVVLQPGNNTYSFTGELYLKTLISNLGTILTQQADALNNGYFELNTTGDSSIVNGQHITYLEKVLSTKTLTAKVPVISLVADFIQAFLGGKGQGSLKDIIGDVFGNSTLLNQILQNFNETQNEGGNGKTTRAVKKRDDPTRGLGLNMFRMALRSSLLF